MNAAAVEQKRVDADRILLEQVLILSRAGLLDESLGIGEAFEAVPSLFESAELR